MERLLSIVGESFDFRVVIERKEVRAETKSHLWTTMIAIIRELKVSHGLELFARILAPLLWLRMDASAATRPSALRRCPASSSLLNLMTRGG